ncbi:MAG: GDP-fucose synthetase [Lentisphaerae bacterium GWF2_49_21]|nr:MAG: GDP-fucose synthetase [Lentisphaerae bacterium GWF2_49_21]
MNKNSKIYIAGHTGMVGSAIYRLLKSKGFRNLVVRTSKQLDLRDTQKVIRFFKAEKPYYVFFCAGRVGGIKANNEKPADFLYDNMMMASNIIHQSYINKVRKLCFLGSSCIYPRECSQPMKEEYLLTGPLEPTNEGYAVAKIAGYKLAYYYAKQHGMNTISIMPCNLYGENDHFDLKKSHVLSSLVKRFVDAADKGRPEVKLWGTGSARREFMNVDDFAEAALLLMGKRTDPEIINVGTGTDLTIKELALKIAKSAGYKGKILWDSSMPDGMPRKCLDISKIRRLGFKPQITLDVGISQMISEYKRMAEVR